MDRKSGGQRRKTVFRQRQEEILEAARALESIVSSGYVVRLLRDAARAEEAAQEAWKALFSGLRPMDVPPHFASNFIKAAPAGVNPFLASDVLSALMRARQMDAKNLNWDGWKGKLRYALSEWVPKQGKGKPPGSFPALVASALAQGRTVEEIAKMAGRNPQMIRKAASDGRKLLGRPRLRKRSPRLPDYSK